MSEHTINVNEHICLQEPSIAYAAELYQVIDFNRSLFREFMAWPDFVKQESDTITFINSCLASQLKGDSQTYLILVNNRAVGTLSFNQIDKQNKTAYIGYWLDKRMQNRGIITRSINALVTYYTKSKVINRFVIKCTVNNIKSNNVAKRCNFLYEGTLKQAEYLNGTFYDQNIYSFVSEYPCIQ